MKVPPDFKPNIDLVKSMEQLKADPSLEGRLRFFKELKSARFLVPCKGGAHNFAIMNTPEKEAFLPGFSCADELQKGSFPCEDVVVLSFEALKNTVIDQPPLTGIALDPFGKVLLLRRPQLAEIDSATEGMTLKRTDYDKPQLLDICRDYPAGLPAALSHLFNTRPEVYRAWILSARRDLTENPHKLFVLDFDGDRKLLFPSVAKVVESFMRPGESFELMKADYSLLQRAQDLAVPVYLKK